MIATCIDCSAVRHYVGSKRPERCLACHHRHLRGEGSGAAQLTERDVEHIDQLLELGLPVKRIAQIAGVKRGTVYDALERRTWSHV